MKKLISVLSEEIIEQLRPNKTNIIRIESFDNPIVYSAVCKNVSVKVDCFIAKLAKEKFDEFNAANKPEWSQALLYLHQGNNAVYADSPNDAYKDNSFVDFNNAITKWRNESANIDQDKTSLILLMGTEAAVDVGGLSDTAYVISPKELASALSANYSLWFSSVLDKNDINTDNCRKSIHTLYRTLFTSVNINLFSLSGFIDEISDVSFASPQEIIDYICETLNRVWGIPSILKSRHIPKISALCKGQLSSAKIISNAVNFIERTEEIPNGRRIEAIKNQFEKYAEKNGIDVSTAFPTESPIYSSYHDFMLRVIDFICGRNIAENRALLLQTDYAIIAEIRDTKLEKHAVEQKTASICGEPVEAFSKMFLDAADLFYNDKNLYPTSYSVAVDKITLSNCIDEQKEDGFMPIASFLGGILQFFDNAGIACNGESVSFSYAHGGIDPFDYANFSEIKDLIKCTGKWGDPCKIHFLLTLSNGTVSKEYEYKWAFSPYCAWPNAFQYLGKVFVKEGDSYHLPIIVTCNNIQDYLGCESEDEFYAQLVQLNGSIHFKEYSEEICTNFDGTDICGQFDAVCNAFVDFSKEITEHGLFNALEELRSLVQEYTSLMNMVNSGYTFLTDIQREKVPLLLGCFTITSNPNVIANYDMGEVIVPAYNPVMLEKTDEKQRFIRDGFKEVMTEKLSSEQHKADVYSMATFTQLASITQGPDLILKKASEFMTCKNMWEYFGVYFSGQSDGELLSGNSFGLSIVTDDDDASAMLRATPMSNIIVRNVMDYIHTFPARVDGLNLAFIAPTDMQHIVSAIHSIAKNLGSVDITATINVRLICLNSRKNSATYLRKSLDSYFSEERNVKVNTFLRNLSVKTITDIEAVRQFLTNCDLCFTYNVLTTAGVQFTAGSDVDSQKIPVKFPMTFTPDTIAATHGTSRKVNISQFQFNASKCHTQASHIAGYPDSKAGSYRAFNTLEMRDISEKIIDDAHKYCKWVVCVDPAIDRKMLEKGKNKIIGFTTGEGSYGELNVTVSARNDILKDIKLMLKKRITEKFKNWSDERLQKAVDYCVDVLSKYMDGSRILKALNPYDYEIHNYLAYVLSVQMLGLSQEDNSNVVRVLISLDSYKHWFVDDTDNMRPDFMLLEIPKSQYNLNPGNCLHIDVKMIECKMGCKNDAHISKAKMQLEKGLRTMCDKWDLKDNSIMYRYWMNQLYRAVIFSPLNLSNTSKEYTIFRDKIYNILSGKVEFSWSGDIFAFWLDSNSDFQDVYPIESNVVSELKREGVHVSDLTCHACGQMYIQKMLLPPEERLDHFAYNEVDAPVTASDSEEEIVPNEDTETSGTETSEDPSAQTVPREPTNNELASGNSSNNTATAVHSAIDTVEQNTAGSEKRLTQKELKDVRLLLGRDLRTNESFYWEFGNKELNNRHLLINGNSGCGKTYCMQALLMEAALQGVSSVVFDYTGGFANSKLDPAFKEALGDRIEQRIVKAKKIPVNPFMKHDIQIDDDIFVPEENADVADKIAEIFKSVYSLGDQQRSAVYCAVLNGLKIHGDNMSFPAMAQELENLGTNHAKTVLSKIQTFTDFNPFTTEETFSWSDIRDSGGKVYVFQLIGYGREIQVLLTELLLWDIWSFCVKSGDETKPFVLVLDEAQNLNHGEKSPSAKILTEGRKFGLSGWYATQFMKPQLTDDEIQRLQQAGQKLYFCPPDDGILTVAKNIAITAQGAKDWSEKLKKLKKGECVTCGSMIRNDRWGKYEPRTIKVTSLKDRLNND